MQSLLSPQERHAFQSFLSSMDLIDTSDHPSPNTLTLDPSEWAMYVSNGNGSDILLDGGEPPTIEGREALSKATKDLMALDRNGSWVGQNGLGNGYDLGGYEQHHGHGQGVGGRPVYSTTHDSFPFLSGKAHHHQQHQDQGHGMHGQLRYSHSPTQTHHQHRQGLGGGGGTSLPPLATNINNGGLRHSPLSASPHSPFGFSSHLVHQPLHSHGQQHQQVHIPQHQHQSISPSSSSPSKHLVGPSSGSTANNNKRARQSSSTSAPARSRSASSPHATSPSASTSTSSASASASASAAAPTNSSATANPNPVNAQQKQALLSPSQKKANHIQSEQKRRANIRRGYEALCEAVPALREAIREEEEVERVNGNGVAVDGNGNATGRVAGKKKRGKKGEGEKDKDKDKLDGRAGPRSENVVLSKTIEHIEHLLADRSALLARLHRARSFLPPGHTASRPLEDNDEPLWEREWKGGEGRLVGLGGEEAEEEGSEDDEG